MASRTLISVEEYLRTSYRPDCDYVDGEVLERNLSERDHSNVQMALSAYLFGRRGEWGIWVGPEIRVQVKPERFRVPDITVTVGKPEEQNLTKPPLLCIEILSSEDRFNRIQDRVRDSEIMSRWACRSFGSSIPRQGPRGSLRQKKGGARKERSAPHAHSAN